MVLEAVAGADDHVDVLRALRAALDLAAETIQMSVQRVNLMGFAAAPDLSDELGPRYYPPGVARQRCQDPKFGRCQLDLAFVAAHLVAAQVNRQPGELQPVGLGTRMQQPGPAKSGVDTRDKFADREGLAHVIVGTDLQTYDHVLRLLQTGDHHDRGLEARGPQPPAHFNAVHVRQHQVQDD
ncbi:prephenate dehydrogenase, partial [mine drainage metagenome]